MPEGFCIANSESRVGSLTKFAQYFPFSAVIVICPQNVLFVHCLTLLLNAFFSEQGSCEKISKSLYGFVECTVFNFKIIISLDITCISIVKS